MTTKKQVKKELTDAAFSGLLEFLKTTRGAHLVGANSHLTRVDDKTIQLHARVNGTTTFYLVTIKEAF